MSTSILKQLKPVVCDFLDKDGNILYEPSGRYIRINIKPDRIEFLRQFIDLLLNTKYISKETKMYISNRYMTISNVYEELKVSNKDINLNTVKAKIFYDKNKIAALFGDDMLAKVIEYKDTDMGEYWEKIYKALEKYGSTGVFDGIALKMPPSNLEKEITDEEFNEFIECIKPYLLTHMQEKSKGINRKVVGYIKYIMSSSVLSKEDIERKEIYQSLF